MSHGRSWNLCFLSRNGIPADQDARHATYARSSMLGRVCKLTMDPRHSSIRLFRKAASELLCKHALVSMSIRPAVSGVCCPRISTPGIQFMAISGGGVAGGGGRVGWSNCVMRSGVAKSDSRSHRRVLSIRKKSKPLRKTATLVLTEIRGSKGANAICWLTPWACRGGGGHGGSHRRPSGSGGVAHRLFRRWREATSQDRGGWWLCSPVAVDLGAGLEANPQG